MMLRELDVSVLSCSSDLLILDCMQQLTSLQACGRAASLWRAAC